MVGVERSEEIQLLTVKVGRSTSLGFQIGVEIKETERVKSRVRQSFTSI